VRLPKWHLVIISVLLLGLAGIGRVDAFTPNSDEYMQDTLWRTPRTVEWQFLQGFPTGAARTRTIDGFNSFNILNQPLKFSTSPGSDLAPADVDFCSTTDPGPTTSYVEWTDHNFSLGTAQVCTAITVDPLGGSFSAIDGFRIRLDSNLSYNWGQAYWWLSKDNIPPAPPTYQDLWSVMSHEVGHAAGMTTGGIDGDGHFDENSNHVCPGESSGEYLERETMCQTNLWQSRVHRNYDDHDRAVLLPAY